MSSQIQFNALVLNITGLIAPTQDLDAMWIAWPTLRLCFPSLVLMEEFVSQMGVDPRPSPSMVNLIDSAESVEDNGAIHALMLASVQPTR